MFCIFKGKIPVLASSGVVTATVGVVMYFVFPVLMNNEIKKRLTLKENTEAYNNWLDIPVPIYLHFYFFNVTNTDEVYDLTNKPVLAELGPYTFREEREKVIVSTNKNGTITYKQVKRWYYDADRTNGSLDDIVTTLNVPMVAVATKGKELDRSVVYFALQELFEYYHCNWFVKKPVRELLFEGYDDPLMKFTQKFVHIPFDKFGWFYKRNGTDDGEYNVFTGENNIEELDKIHTWNGLKKVSSFDPPCNSITGSAGDMWPPHLTPESRVTMFVADICRSMTFTYLTEVQENGVRLYRYYSDKTQLDNGEFDPDNRCFCSGGVCLPAGAINASSCKFDAPAVVSYPHFLYADPIYRNKVIGMKPDAEKHQMFLDLVPEMGIPLGVAARMQINIVFEAIPDIQQFQNITERIYFPVLWFSETAVAGEDITSRLKLVLSTIPTISEVVSILSVIAGIILTLTALTLSIRNSYDREQTLYAQVAPE